MEKISLGCQTIGSSINRSQAFEILDYCQEKGIFRFDLAERYPFPEKKETVGLSELIFGEWLKFQQNRETLRISTKVTGRNDGVMLGKSSTRLTRDRINQAVNKSLMRLKTDYIDIFFLHWPDRYTNNFGRTYYSPDLDPLYISIEDQFETLLKLRDLGKIKQFGLSNETPWGLMKFSNLSQLQGWPLVYQTEYSAIDRRFEMSMLEICIRENISSECHSILSGGLLSNKYKIIDKALFGEGRLIQYPEKTQRHQSLETLSRYEIFLKFCEKNNIDPFPAAVRYAVTRNFFDTVIVGASSLSQLKEILSVSQIQLRNEAIFNSY